MTTDNETIEPAARAGAHSEAMRKLVVVHLAKQSYGIAIEEVEEILPMAQLSLPPECPGLLAGFVNIANDPIPVVKLSRLFGSLDLEPELYTPIILLRSARLRLALLVERVSRIVTIRQGDVAPLGNGHCLNNSVAGMVRQDGTNILVLNIDRLLLEQEQRRLEALQAGERARLSRTLEASA